MVAPDSEAGCATPTRLRLWRALPSDAGPGRLLQLHSANRALARRTGSLVNPAAGCEPSADQVANAPISVPAMLSTTSRTLPTRELSTTDWNTLRGRGQRRPGQHGHPPEPARQQHCAEHPDRDEDRARWPGSPAVNDAELEHREPVEHGEAVIHDLGGRPATDREEQRHQRTDPGRPRARRHRRSGAQWSRTRSSSAFAVVRRVRSARVACSPSFLP